MKSHKHFYCLIILITLLAINCKKKNDDLDMQGTGSALKNGQAWEAQVRSILYDKNNQIFGLVLVNPNKKYVVADWLDIVNIPLKEGVYQLYKHFPGIPDSLLKSQLSIATNYGEDLELYSWYFPISEDSCQLNITSITKKNDIAEVEGMFYGTYVEDTIFLTPEHLIPDTVRFQNGTFKCKVDL